MSPTDNLLVYESGLAGNKMPVADNSSSKMPLTYTYFLNVKLNGTMGTSVFLFSVFA